MIIWFLFEIVVYEIHDKIKFVKINKKIVNTTIGVYNNPYKPRYDDFIFNIIGIISYILVKKL